MCTQRLNTPNNRHLKPHYFTKKLEEPLTECPLIPPRTLEHAKLIIDDIGQATPAMTSLIRAGIELDQHYAFKFCSPTRSAIQSGRHPIHVNVQNYQPTVWDYAAPTRNVDSGFAGVSRNMTTLAAVMKRGGYATHFAGKWDVGMAHPDMTPSGRGYDTSLFYFHHDNDCTRLFFCCCCCSELRSRGSEPPV